MTRLTGRRLGLAGGGRRVLLLAVAFCLLTMSGFAERVRMELARGTSPDAAGQALRRAVTAYEAALAQPLPADWTRVSLRANGSANFGQGAILVLRTGGSVAPGLLFVDSAGPHNGTLSVGERQRLGSLEVIVLSAPRSGAGAELLVRSAGGVAPLLASDTSIPPGSTTAITVFDSPREVVVETPSPQIAAFSKEFLRQLNNGLSAEEAARRAREASPPARLAVSDPLRTDYTDPRNFFDADDPDLPSAAAVTLHLVRGDSAALRELESSLSYDSAGRVPEEPRVRGGSGPRGGTVEVGSPGDRFRGRMRLYEASGKLQVESETLLRVPLGGRSLMTIMGPGGQMSAWMEARPRGRNAVDLAMDQEQGDWSFLGSVSTQVRVRDGQTITLAKNTYRRETSQRGNVPILGDIPWVGPIFTNERSTSESYSYALYATVEIQ